MPLYSITLDFSILRAVLPGLSTFKFFFMRSPYGRGPRQLPKLTPKTIISDVLHWSVEVVIKKGLESHAEVSFQGLVTLEGHGENTIAICVDNTLVRVVQN